MLRSLPLWSICVCGFSHQWLLITLIAYTPTYINSVFNINVRDVSAFPSMPFSSVHDPPIILFSQIIPSRKVYPLPLPQNHLGFNTNAGSFSKDMIEESTDFLQTMRSQDCQYDDQWFINKRCGLTVPVMMVYSIFSPSEWVPVCPSLSHRLGHWYTRRLAGRLPPDQEF
ncbi:unnamed protein product [Gulo gulo]|uniref:Uncharacterized protein n=1 Tax=Gulo gulo TaxID=48420 RepID=A0A9X9Q4T0_GULGU|nr:unnamed protein product [Gulo gulo]